MERARAAVSVGGGYIGRAARMRPADLFSALRLLWDHFRADSLFRNSVYLMASTGILAFCGFFFWILAARLYSTAEIGLATALISATVLLSNFSLLGVNTALVRFLPGDPRPGRSISTALGVVGAATLIISAVYLLALPHVNPQLSEILSHPVQAGLFLLFMVAVSANTLTDSVFVAWRASGYNLAVYTVFGLLKLVLPVFLVALGAYGIFFSYTASVVAALLLSLFFMVRRFGTSLRPALDRAALRKWSGYSFGTYLANFLSGVPTLAMPSIIIARLGPEAAAFFYVSAMIGELLHIIPSASTQSMLAEGSHDQAALSAHIKKTLRTVYALTIPAVLAVMLLGPFVLYLFGSEYAQQGAWVLRLLALSMLFVGINLVGETILHLDGRIRRLILINLGYVGATIAFALILAPYGLMGAALALLLGQAVAAVPFGLITLRTLRRA